MINSMRKKLDSLRSSGFDGDVRGMIGIGTLIVFIAMVIVAAVAAGVLINTSGNLQEQARATGQETIRQVSSGVQVMAVKGRTDNGTHTIENLEVVTKLRAGSQGIDLGKTVIQYKSPYEEKHLLIGENAAARTQISQVSDDGQFDVVKVQNTSATENYMLGATGDLSEIWIYCPTPLEPSDTVSLSIMPASGFQTYAKGIVPATVKSGEGVYEMR